MKKVLFIFTFLWIIQLHSALPEDIQDYCITFRGIVTKFLVVPGQYFEAGQPLIEIDDMKMQFTIRAQGSGYINKIKIIDSDSSNSKKLHYGASNNKPTIPVFQLQESAQFKTVKECNVDIEINSFNETSSSDLNKNNHRNITHKLKSNIAKPSLSQSQHYTEKTKDFILDHIPSQLQPFISSIVGFQILVSSYQFNYDTTLNIKDFFSIFSPSLSFLKIDSGKFNILKGKKNDSDSDDIFSQKKFKGTMLIDVKEPTIFDLLNRIIIYFQEQLVVTSVIIIIGYRILQIILGLG